MHCKELQQIINRLKNKKDQNLISKKIIKNLYKYRPTNLINSTMRLSFFSGSFNLESSSQYTY